MKCPRCSPSLRVYEQTTELSCYDRGADLEVEREHCTITLRIIELFSPAADRVPLACTKREDLKTLQAEAERLMTVKRVAGMLTGCHPLMALAATIKFSNGHKPTYRELQLVNQRQGFVAPGLVPRTAVPL